MLFNKEIYKEPEALLQKLIQFNTSNPPGNEKECIEFIKIILEDAGIDCQLIGTNDNRPNLYARIKGKSDNNPLLLYGHVDVVPVEGQNWSVDPFEAVIKDGYIWGRGAIDMKGEVAMFICIMLKIKCENIALPHDLILTLLSDEEGSGIYGAKYLVENRPELFDGVKYAFGEIGGFSFRIGDKKFYPIMVAEKQIVQVKISARGEGGHASLSHHNTPMTKIAKAIVALDEKPLPVRITPAVRLMIEGMTEGMGGIKGMVLKQLLNPRMTNLILKILGDSGSIFAPLLHNSVNSTIVSGGSAINVIPALVEIQVDMRMVPGATIEEGIADIERVIGKGYEIEIMSYDKGNCKLDMTLFNDLKAALIKMDKEAIPVPFVLAACTDGRFFGRIGIQTYGYTPMLLPDEYDFAAMAHSADERIPLGALDFGIKTIMEYLIGGK